MAVPGRVRRGTAAPEQRRLPLAPSSGGGYVTVNFTLELSGPYVCFKQLLARLPQTKMIIRISQFELKNPGKDAPYDWTVQIQFQTYFES